MAKKSRRSKLKDTEELQVTVPLRDQIPARLLAKVREMKLGRKIVESWTVGNAHRQDWLDRQREYLADWDDHVESNSEGPFDWSSTLHLPLTFVAAKTVHARFMRAINSGDPVPLPRTEAAVASSEVVRQLLSYTLKEWANHRRGVTDALDPWLWDWITTGTGLLKLRWERKFESYVDVVNIPVPQEPRIVEHEDGTQEMVQDVRMVEREEKVTRLVYEGPVFKDLRVEDLLIVGHPDPQLADSVTESVWLTESELWSLADQGVFDEETVKEIIQGGPDEKLGSDLSGLKADRAENSGHGSEREPNELDRWEILEDYRRVCVDDSGIDSEVVTWVHRRSMKELRATYLRRINKAGERPYSKIDYHLRPGHIHGTGLVEMMYPLAKEMDAMHNLRIDFGVLATMPFGFYRSTSGIDPETVQLEPGALIPVDNPSQDVFFPNLGNRTAFGFQEEAALQTWSERISTTNDLSAGVLTGAQGATRTATGVRGLLGEQNANLDVHLRRLNTGWKHALESLLHMLQQKMPAGLEFRVSGDTGDYYFMRVQDRAEIQGDFDFELTTNSSNTNRAIQQQNANEMLQLVMNPLLIQMGIVGPRNQYEAIKEWMQARDMKGIGRFITEPLNQPLILTPMEEINRVLSGIEVPVQPGQNDHQGFLAMFQEVMSNPEILGQYDQRAVLDLARQAQAHQQALAAVQQAQAQAANTQQMQINTGQGMVQAPPGLGPAPSGGGIPDGQGQTE